MSAAREMEEEAKAASKEEMKYGGELFPAPTKHVARTQ
jgi:hypothetical protein